MEMDMNGSVVEACFQKRKHQEETSRNERMLDLHTEKEEASMAFMGRRHNRT